PDIEMVSLLLQKSTISSLYPFPDEKGILRVGYRFQYSQQSFNSKHLVIMPGPVTVRFNKDRGYIALFLRVAPKAFHKKKQGIVLVNMSSGVWSLGRISHVHTEKNGIVRIVTAKTANGYSKRPVIKLSLLPLNQE
ncbi:hypothetical protein NPIL_129541, partial [Nephila pilipes]